MNLILDFVTVAFNVRGGLFSHESTSYHTITNSIFYNPDAEEEIGRRASGAIMDISYTSLGSVVPGCDNSDEYILHNLFETYNISEIYIK